MATIYRRRSPARRRIILAAFVVAAIVLITIDFTNDGSRSSGLRKVLLGVVQPVESAVGTVFRPVGRFFSGVIHSSDIARENEQLRKENEELRKSRDDVTRLSKENDELRSLTNLQNPDKLDFITSRVIGVPATNSDWSLTIDAGTRNGAADGNPVVSGEGLVGRVIDATAGSSKVVLLADPQMAVGVRDERSGVTGVVTGQGSSTLRLELVDASADVKVDDMLSTSGFEGSRFPAGIRVGKVVKVAKDKSGLALAVEVEPLVNAARRDYLSVLLWTPKS